MFNVSKKPMTFIYCAWNKDLFIDSLLFGLSEKVFEMKKKRKRQNMFTASSKFSSKIEKNVYCLTSKYTQENRKNGFI